MPRESLAMRLRQAFLEHGYDPLTMSMLAPLCGMSRRALYHHFSSKAEAFRHMLKESGDLAIIAGMTEGRRLLAQDRSVLDIVTTIVDVRYGEARRLLGSSRHAAEINDKAFQLAREMMVEQARAFQAELAALIAEMAGRNLLVLRPGTSPDMLAQLLCDGARGTNQTLPPIPPSQLPARYRAMLSAILFGATTGPS